MNVCGHAKRFILVLCAGCSVVAGHACVLYPIVKTRKFLSIKMTSHPIAVK